MKYVRFGRNLSLTFLPVAIRAWCVTVNQELDKFHSALSEPTAPIKDSVRYAVWQFEKAPETGRIHIQAYLKFKSPRRIAFVKSLFGISSLHLEKRMGSDSQARDYCMKEESRHEGKGPYEYGTFEGEQGKRNDLQDATKTLKTQGLKGVAANHPATFVKYHSGFKALEYITSTAEVSHALRNVDVTCIWGAPGTGKTRFCFDLSKSMNVPAYRLMPPSGRNSQLWFDGYEGQKILIIDEMNGNWMPWNFLMNLLDVYPLQLPIKGSHQWARFTTILITSNVAPGDWYPFYDQGMDKQALMRRISHTYMASIVEDELARAYVLADEQGDVVDKQQLIATYIAANEVEIAEVASEAREAEAREGYGEMSVDVEDQ